MSSLPPFVPDDCYGRILTLSNNLMGDLTGCILEESDGNVLIGEDPQLGHLQNNGGETVTFALLDGTSPSLDTSAV
jgi:hypothetical protein